MSKIDIEIILASDANNQRLRAYVNLVISLDSIGNFKVRDLKVIQGRNDLFLSMPSRKVKRKCFDCNGKNELLAKFCNWCGVAFDMNSNLDEATLYQDIFHPTDHWSRDALERLVLEAYRKKKESSDAGTIKEDRREDRY